jgi:hypothetical protein
MLHFVCFTANVRVYVFDISGVTNCKKSQPHLDKNEKAGGECPFQSRNAREGESRIVRGLLSKFISKQARPRQGNETEKKKT